MHVCHTTMSNLLIDVKYKRKIWSVCVVCVCVGGGGGGGEGGFFLKFLQGGGAPGLPVVYFFL